jgi:signal transduction histidine kinase
MDQLQQFTHRARLYTYILIFFTNILVIAAWWASSELLEFNAAVVLAILFIVATVTPLLVIQTISTIFMQPLKFLWQAILYIAPETSSVPAPELHNLKYARELVTNLVNHVYQLADVSKHVADDASSSTDELSRSFIANSLPLPLVVLDKDQSILFANNAFTQYVHTSKDEVIQKNVYSVLDFSFENEHTLDVWLKQAKEHHVATSQIWERVKLRLRDDQGKTKTLLLDLVAYYNKSNPSGYETMLVCFDRTKAYGQDDQAINFVALAVHELRTPLTMLRGYIEALDEELEGKIDDELAGFLKKTQAAAGQLATFVNNILNVAQLEDDQMVLKLQEENWQEVLQSTIDDLQIRSQVRGISIKVDIAKDIPSVGIDRLSMYEVIGNLVDNAIKYSGHGKEILVSAALNKEGRVETTVQDFGVGVPSNVVEHIFDKFYRDHHNRAQIGGTGLGLYLCKSVVKAHGGTIWVRSKEGEGSTFGFTLLPYKDLADEQKNLDNEGIVRNAHGWIKNHSMYRR